MTLAEWLDTEHRDAEDDCSDRHPGSAERTTG